jgi:DNA-directed RNA polymerase specialized sigma24 family protein
MTQAEALLADEYEGSKAEVQRTVAAKLGRDGLAGVDLGAAYNEAWHALYLRLAADEPIDNRKAFLVTVTYRRALSERRASRPERLDGEADLEGLGVEPDIDARLDAELQLRHFIQGLRAELDERELQAATLTYLHGLSRPEAAKVIGIAPRRMEKVMDRASKRIAAVIDAVRPGELCEELDSPIRAFAVGLLDEEGERYAVARDHLATCPACRRKVLVLRGLGAIAPPLPGLLTGLGGAGALAGAGAGGLAAGGSSSSAGPVAAQAAAGKLALVNLGAKLAALSQKTVLIAGAVAATTAVVVVGTVAVVGGAGGPASGAPAAESPAGRDVAGADDGYVAVPQLHPRRQEQRDRRPPEERHRRKQRRQKQQQREQPAEEVAPETTTAPEETYEAPVETYVEPTPEEANPTPTEEPAPTESTKPTTNAAVEFELH